MSKNKIKLNIQNIKTLGHKDKHATAIYARVSKDVARESMENAVNEMFRYSN